MALQESDVTTVAHHSFWHSLARGGHFAQAAL